MRINKDNELVRASDLMEALAGENLFLRKHMALYIE